MTARTRIATILLATGLATSLASCSADSIGAPANSAGADTVTIGTLRSQPHLYTPYFYDKVDTQGLTFEVVQFDTSTDIKNAVVSGAIDFGVTGAASVISGAVQGQDIQIVASSADGGSRIVASSAITDVAGLAGTKVGYPMGATQEILLKRTLEANGIDPDADVTLVNLPFSDLANALDSGQIDAFVSAEVGPSVAIQNGAHELVSPYDTSIGKTNIVLATKASTVSDDPDLVQKVVDVHAAATEYELAHADEWVGGLVDDFGLDQAVVETAIANIWPRWDIDDAYVATLQGMSDEMTAFGQIPAKADLTTLVTTKFVDAVVTP